MNKSKIANQKVRDNRIDSVKFWLIILVIAGHVSTRHQFSDNPECYAIGKWIYIFHMPLFIFISGYFSRKKNKIDFIASIWKLLEPLILFQVIARLLDYIIGLSFSFSFQNILTPWWVLWYLLSLIYWRLLLQIIPDSILRNTKLVLFTTLIISLFAGFFPFNRFLSIQRTLSFLPFFFLGFYMRNKNICLPNKYKLLSSFFLILTFLIPIFASDYLGDLKHADPYKSVNDMYRRFIIFAISIPMSLAFINLCPKTKLSAKLGRFTLQYYIFHAFIINPFLVTAINKLGLPTSSLAVVVYTVAIATGIGLATFLPNFNKFTNPSSFFKSTKVHQSI